MTARDTNDIHVRIAIYHKILAILYNEALPYYTSLYNKALPYYTSLYNKAMPYYTTLV